MSKESIIEIVLDTETTGLDPKRGDRLIEIGCRKMVNGIVTEEKFHQYINPQGQKVSDRAFEIHGISDKFLEDMPTFPEIVDSFLEFIGNAKLVIHNASFDLMFINHELNLLNRPIVNPHNVVDTLQLARKRYPGKKNTLDALCDRLGVDLSRRNKHGALLDAELLAEVYTYMRWEMQNFIIAPTPEKDKLAMDHNMKSIKRKIRSRRRFKPSHKEIEAHIELIRELKEPLWM